MSHLSFSALAFSAATNAAAYCLRLFLVVGKPLRVKGVALQQRIGFSAFFCHNRLQAVGCVGLSQRRTVGAMVLKHFLNRGKRAGAFVGIRHYALAIIPFRVYARSACLRQAYKRGFSDLSIGCEKFSECGFRFRRRLVGIGKCRTTFRQPGCDFCNRILCRGKQFVGIVKPAALSVALRLCLRRLAQLPGNHRKSVVDGIDIDSGFRVTACRRRFSTIDA